MECMPEALAAIGEEPVRAPESARLSRFGCSGPDLNTIHVSTMRNFLNEADHAAGPQAGGTFRANVWAGGLPAPCIAWQP